jgi:hypothetical protein
MCEDLSSFPRGNVAQTGFSRGKNFPHTLKEETNCPWFCITPLHPSPLLSQPEYFFFFFLPGEMRKRGLYAKNKKLKQYRYRKRKRFLTKALKP